MHVSLCYEYLCLGSDEKKMLALLLQVLVKDVLSQGVVGLEGAQAGDLGGEVGDGGHLLLQEVVLQDVGQVSVARGVGRLVQVQQQAVDEALGGQRVLEGQLGGLPHGALSASFLELLLGYKAANTHAAAVVAAHVLGVVVVEHRLARLHQLDVVELRMPTALVHVVDEHLGVVALLQRGGGEELLHAGQRHVGAGEVRRIGLVDVGGLQFLDDLGHDLVVDAVPVVLAHLHDVVGIIVFVFTSFNV